MTTLTEHYPKTVLAVAVATLIASPSWAQGNADRNLEEVIVTATKRESTLQDLPFSINAQSQRDIERIGATTLEDVSRSVAGLSIQNLGPGQSQVAIRGVSAGQIVRDQPGVKEQVGVYLDESVISLSLFTPDLDLFDVNRVETLRGPQGTLFGSGSIGGTIRYITNQPNLQENQATIEFNVNSVSDGDNGGHMKSMVNIPLVEDVAALRLVTYNTQYAGFIDALFENGPSKEDVNSGSRSGGRIALTWTPSESLTITPRVIFQEIEADGFNRQEVFNVYANPFTTTRPAIQLDEREQYLLLDEAFEDEILIVDNTINISLADAFDIDVITSYTDREILVSRDTSALAASVSIDFQTLFSLSEEAALLQSNLRDTTEVEQITNELRVSSNAEGAFQWLVGLFHSDTERRYAQRLPTPGYDDFIDAAPGLGPGTSAAVANGFPADSPFNSDIPYDLEQLAIFGEINYDIGERIHLTLGGRYYDYEEERSYTTGGIFSNTDNQTDDTSSDGFMPRVMASFDLSNAITVNAQASQGFRLGGVNDPLNESLCNAEDLAIFGGFQSYDDETLWNYEVGLKSRFGWLSFDSAVFYADIEDLQVTLDAGSCSSRISFNVPEAHTAGLEFELTAQPTDYFYISFDGSVLEAEFDSTVRDGTGAVIGGLEEGNRLASVPELQLAVAGTLSFATEAMGANEWYLSGSVQHVGDRITQPSDQVAGAGTFTSGLAFGGADGDEVTELELELDAYETLNVRTGLVYDAWEAILYVNNLTDENANLSFDRERGGRARLAFRTNQPRTLGITLRARF